jgi:prolyl 4-hydroxylase
MTAPSDHSADLDEARVRAIDRVLVGANGAGAAPEEAAQLYAEAMAAGCGAAAARLAVLAAVGVARPSNWSEALDRLADAAELGNRPAQKQLAVLAERDDLAGRTGNAALWRNLRKEIDLGKLLAPPRSQQIHLAPGIGVIEGLATRAMCRWIISRGKGRLERPMVRDVRTGQGVPDPIRTALSTGFGLSDTDVVIVLTQTRLQRASGLMVHQQEAPFLLSYEPGQEYKPHFDFMDPGIAAFQNQLAIMGQRVATCFTYLNEDYDGGETDFPRIGWRFRGKAGDALLFANVTSNRQPDPMTLHAGLPVTRGRKYLLSQWIRDRVQAIV